MKPNYKDRAISVDTSSSGGRNGPYKASFAISRKHQDNWVVEHQGFIEREFSSENEAHEAASAAAQTWIDQNAHQ